MQSEFPDTDGEPRSRRRRETIWLAAILVLAAALRLWGLGVRSLWLDEIMTVQKASASFRDMMRQITQHDAHPPFFQIVEWLWLRMGRGDAFARMPAVIAGVAGVWLSFLLARRLLGRKAAVAAGLLMALSYFHIFYSQEARLHTLIIALFLAQTYLLLRIADRRGKAGWGLWAAYGLVGLASLYTYALCALTVGSLALLYLWLTWKRGRQIKEWLIVHALIALLFLPWVPVMRERTAILEASVREHHDAVGRPSASEISAGIATWGAGATDWQKPSPMWPWLGLGLVVAAAAVLLDRRTRKPAKILGTLFILPLAGYLLLPMPRVHAYDTKHLAFLQPILIIALSGARVPVRRESSDEGRLPPVFYVVFGLGALNIYGLSDYYRSDFQKEDWRTLCAEVSARAASKDVILFNPDYAGFAFDYYAKIPPEIDRSPTSDLLNPKVEIAPGYRRIWLIEDRSAVARPRPEIPARLAQLGWTPVESRLFRDSVGELRWTLFAPASRSGKGPPP